MQTTIYIRKENEELWNSMDDKSAYVNALLTKELSGIVFGHENVGRLQDEMERRFTADIPTPKSAEKALKTLSIPKERLENGTCKIHATPLDSRGKRLQKGCKYS